MRRGGRRKVYATVYIIKKRKGLVKKDLLN